MSRFNARINILNSVDVTPGVFDITAHIVDNSGQFYFGDLSLNDIIYVNGYELGEPLVKKYTITGLTNISVMPVLLRISYAGAGDPLTPYGSEAIVGKPNGSNIIHIPDPSTSQISSLFHSAVQNFQVDVEASTSAVGGGNYGTLFDVATRKQNNSSVRWDSTSSDIESFVAEDSSKKNQPSGYAGLTSDKTLDPELVISGGNAGNIALAVGTRVLKGGSSTNLSTLAINGGTSNNNSTNIINGGTA